MRAVTCGRLPLSHTGGSSSSQQTESGHPRRRDALSLLLLLTKPCPPIVCISRRYDGHSLYSQARGSVGWLEVLGHRCVPSDIQTEGGGHGQERVLPRARLEAQERAMETGDASHRLGVELGRCPPIHISEAQGGHEATPHTDGLGGNSGWKRKVFRQTIQGGEKSQK